MAERILVLGITPLTEEILIELERRPRRYSVAGILELDGGQQLEAAVRDTAPDLVVVAASERRGHLSMRTLIDLCARHRLKVEEAVTFYERLTGRLALDSLSPSSIVFHWNLRPSRFHAAFNRLMGAFVALTVLILCAPLLALIAIAIKLESPGPVMFVQDRIGALGRPFRLKKFRTMRVASGKTSEWEADNIGRVTPIGKWLRRFRLDELPQFVNVLRGEMNLVGPRPHPVTNGDLFMLVGRNLNERTGSPVAYYALRSISKPGVTGWAQVRYRYANNLEEEIEKLRYDLYYIKHQSPWLDLRILVETVLVLILARGAAEPASAQQRKGRLRSLDLGRDIVQ